MWGFAICLATTLVVLEISRRLFRWINPKFSDKLPPGSMGFPIIGETFDFFKPYGFYELSPFLTKRISRYGPLFRTNILGLKAVVSTDPDVNFEIFKEDECFGPGFPDAIVKLFGQDNFLEMGNLHKYLKGIAVKFVGPEGLKQRLIDSIDSTISSHFQLVAARGSFDAKETASSMIIDSLTKKVTRDIEPETKRQLKENWKGFKENWFNFSLNIPGTTLHRLLSARRKARNLIRSIIEEKKTVERQPGDFFMDLVLEEMEKEGTDMNEERATDIVFIILLASQETSPLVIAATVKLISDHPQVLQELKKEHEKILESRKTETDGVTWQEYKSMTFTHMVINETLRLVSSEPALYRKAKRDVEIKGYTIPAGWYVIGVPTVHLDPQVYDHPFDFNPWRWEGKEMRSASRTFMAFGNGARLCAGAEFVKLFMSIFLHYLVTKYRWSVAEEAKLNRTPRVGFPSGMKVNIAEASK